MIIHTKDLNLLRASSPPARLFYLSPLRELRWALHVLSSPSYHGVFLRWALEVRQRLAPSFLERIDRLAPFFLVGLYLPVASEGQGQPDANFEHELDGYRTLSEEARTTLYRHYEYRWIHDFDTRMARHSEWENWARMAQPAWWTASEESGTHWWDELGTVMKDFWDQEFASIWSQIVVEMQRDIKNRLTQVADSPTAWWQRISPRIRLEQDTGTMRVLVPWKTEMTVSTTRMALFPSVFCWPHLWVEGIQDGLSITYQSQAIIDWASPIPTSGRLERLLEMVSEPTRFLIVRHLFGTMGTTSSIARELRLSPSTISRHLTLLHSSGLVDRIAMGHYALYRTNREVFLSIAHELEQLQRPPVPEFLGWE